MSGEGGSRGLGRTRLASEASCACSYSTGSYSCVPKLEGPQILTPPLPDRVPSNGSRPCIGPLTQAIHVPAPPSCWPQTVAVDLSGRRVWQMSEDEVWEGMDFVDSHFLLIRWALVFRWAQGASAGGTRAGTHRTYLQPSVLEPGHLPASKHAHTHSGTHCTYLEARSGQGASGLLQTAAQRWWRRAQAPPQGPSTCNGLHAHRSVCSTHARAAHVCARLTVAGTRQRIECPLRTATQR